VHVTHQTLEVLRRAVRSGAEAITIHGQKAEIGELTQDGSVALHQDGPLYEAVKVLVCLYTGQAWECSEQSAPSALWEALQAS
jgi:tRNA-dihydrouridine synthase